MPSSVASFADHRPASPLSYKYSTRGAKIAVLLTDSHASRNAYKMARALTSPERDVMHLVTCVPSDEFRVYGERLLESFVEPALGTNVVTTVLVKPAEMRLHEALADHVAELQPDLCVFGSHRLGQQATRDNPQPAMGSFAMKLARVLRGAPLLVAKLSSRSPYLRSDNEAAPLKCMVDVQSNSRHLMCWLMDRMNPEKDIIYLAATKAFDQFNQRKDAKVRMLTTFGVQASTNAFSTTQRMFKEGPAKVLPKAVEDDSIDMLAVQAPECRVLPQHVLELLSHARTNILIYHLPASQKQQQQMSSLNSKAMLAMPGAATDQQGAQVMTVG